MDGSYYQGSFEDGKRVHGKYASKDGAEEYEGDWRGLARHGVGKAKMKDVGMYDGEWEEDNPHGKGKFRYVDGAEYDGLFVKGKRQGNGKMRFANGDAYVGEWQDDVMHGKGYMELDGDRYAGEFVKGKKQGGGRMRFANGDVYEGAWMEGKPHGPGIMKYGDGSVYRGEFAEGKRHGQGKCKFEDGTTFKGAWDDDGWVQTAADAAKSRVAGAGIVRAEAGKVSKFLIHARDVVGNKRLSGGDDFRVVLERCIDDDGGDGTSEHANRGEDDRQISICGNVTDKDDGTYEVVYVPEVAGVYELNVMCGDYHVADSPYPIRVLPGASEFGKTIVTGVQTSVRLGESSSFEIRAHDRFGNRSMVDSLGDFEVLLDGEPLVERVITPDGRIICSFACTAPGRHLLTITGQGGRSVPGTPFSILCCAGEDAENVEAGEGGVTAKRAPSKWETMTWDDEDDDWDSEDNSDDEDGGAANDGSVPVVENLEDLWLVSKLQQERKVKEENDKRKKLDAMREALEQGGFVRAADSAPVLLEASDIQDIGGDASGSEAKTSAQQTRARTKINLSREAKALDEL